MPNLYATPPANRNFQPSYIPQDVPVYRVTEEKGFYIDNVLHPAGTILEFAETPNPGLEPMNDIAVEKQRAYLTHLDMLGNKKSERDNTSYVPLVPAFEKSLEAKSRRRRGGEAPMFANKVKFEPRAFVVDQTPIATGPIQSVGSLAKGGEDDTDHRAESSLAKKLTLDAKPGKK